MKAKATRLEIKRQQQAIRAKEVAREKAIHDENVAYVIVLLLVGGAAVRTDEMFRRK